MKAIQFSYFLLALSLFAVLPNISLAKDWDGYAVVRAAYQLKNEASNLDHLIRADDSADDVIVGLSELFTSATEDFSQKVNYLSESPAATMDDFNALMDLFHSFKHALEEKAPNETIVTAFDKAHEKMHELKEFYHQ